MLSGQGNMSSRYQQPPQSCDSPMQPSDIIIAVMGITGAGKTTFARALVRHVAEDPELDVPSPTFTLMQLYPTAAFPIVHADLYRIRSTAELAELGWEEAAEGSDRPWSVSDVYLVPILLYSVD